MRLPVSPAVSGLLIAAGVAVLLIGIHHPRSGASPAEGPVQLTSVVPDSTGAVTLEWTDGKDRVYKVLKSTDPQDFRNAVAYAVRGNRWTDRSTSPGQVVYYKVE